MIIFEKMTPVAVSVAAGYAKHVADYNVYVLWVFGQPQRDGATLWRAWKPPHEGILKVNIDAHVYLGGINVGCGC